MAIKIRILEEETKAADFDTLFHGHMARLGRYDLLPDEIEPSRLRAIHEAIDRMDAAWLAGDLEGFKTAMNETERLYFGEVK